MLAQYLLPEFHHTKGLGGAAAPAMLPPPVPPVAPVPPAVSVPPGLIEILETRLNITYLTGLITCKDRSQTHKS